MPKPVKVSLDQIYAERQFSVRSTAKGDALTKTFKAPASWDEASRSAKFVMTAQVPDRYGDVVVTNGADTAEFEKNPVVLWAHNSRDFPIGMWSDVVKISGKPRRMEGVANFNAEGTNENADQAVRLITQGHLRACSIGFMPKEYEVMRDKEEHFLGYQFNEWELLECSVCSVPANPAAIIKAAGGDERLALQAIELVLDEWHMTPEGLIVPRAQYERAYTVTKNAGATLHEVRSIDEDGKEDALTPVVTELDIEAAVSRGVEKVADSLFAKFMATFSKSKEPEVIDEPTLEIKIGEEDDGETEEEFQARMAARKAAEPELADEAEEAELRARAAAFASA